LGSVLKKADEEKHQWIEEKQEFPASFGEDKGSLHPEELKRGENVQDSDHHES
jgi:hypothetical protein